MGAVARCARPSCSAIAAYAARRPWPCMAATASRRKSGRHAVVAVEEGDVAAAGLLQAAVAGGTDARPVLGDHADPLVARRPLLQHLGRLVGGPVVHDDQLPVLQGLGADRLERRCDDAWPVPDRDHHAHQWVAVGALGERGRGPLRPPHVLGVLVPVVEHPRAGVPLLLADQQGPLHQRGAGRAPRHVGVAREGGLVVRRRQEEAERTSGVLGALGVGAHGLAVEQRPETAVGALAAQVAEQRPGLAPGEPVSHPPRQHGPGRSADGASDRRWPRGGSTAPPPGPTRRTDR